MFNLFKRKVKRNSFNITADSVLLNVVITRMQLQTGLTVLKTTGINIERTGPIIKYDNIKEIDKDQFYYMSGNGGWLHPNGLTTYSPPIAYNPDTFECYWAMGIGNSLQYDNRITDTDVLDAVRKNYEKIHLQNINPLLLSDVTGHPAPVGYEYYWNYGTFKVNIPDPFFMVTDNVKLSTYEKRILTQRPFEHNFALAKKPLWSEPALVITSSIGGNICISRIFPTTNPLPDNCILNISCNDLDKHHSRVISISIG